MCTFFGPDSGQITTYETIQSSMLSGSSMELRNYCQFLLDVIMVLWTYMFYRVLVF